MFAAADAYDRHVGRYSGKLSLKLIDAAGLDSEKYTGWAFGMGPARIAMSRHAIHDIRLLYDSDVRFLEQFAP